MICVFTIALTELLRRPAYYWQTVRDNTVAIVTSEGIERWERAPKAEVAQRLAARIAKALQ